MEVLAERVNDGKVVKLWWDKNDNDHPVTVTVRDLWNEEHFIISPIPEKALDAFYHPYAYAPEGVSA